MDGHPGPYAGAHIANTHQKAIDTMRYSEESTRYENIDNDIGKELSRSVEYCNVQFQHPGQITVGFTRPISSEGAQNIPDVVPRNSDCQEPPRISGVDQVIINDDIYYCPLDATKSSPGSSDDEDIYENNQ